MSLDLTKLKFGPTLDGIDITYTSIGWYSMSVYAIPCYVPNNLKKILIAKILHKQGEILLGYIYQHLMK